MKNFIKSLTNAIKNLAEVIVLVLLFVIFMVLWILIVNFTYDNQWVVLVLDVTCIWLFSTAIKRNIPNSMIRNRKDKFIFIALTVNVVILILASWGALWNFLLMMFLIVPLSIYFSGKFKTMVN
jgi:hypothetical protein